MNQPTDLDLQALLQLVTQIAASAGEAILDVYAQADFGVAHKADSSPVTDADLRANRIILAGLARISRLPVLTEEAAEVPYDVRRKWHSYWLVDPLDGTKEFVSRNGEFTVNIALIVDHRPALGVVYAPATRTLYGGASASGGAFRQRSGGTIEPISVVRAAESRVRVVGSRSHGSKDTDQYLNWLGPHSLIAIGSSLKLCLVAEGAADVYPRFSPTSEWDIAAGHAVLLAAGGDVRLINGEPLRYNTKPGIHNPSFVAYGDAERRWLPE